MSQIIVVRAWPWVAGLLVGMLVVPLLVDEFAAWREAQRLEAQRREPVIRSVSTVLARTSDHVIVHITGEKLRPCTFKGLQAYVLSATGVMRSTPISRDDDPPVNATRPLGSFDAGNWRIALEPHQEAVVWASYDCGDGQAVLNVLARVPPQ